MEIEGKTIWQIAAGNGDSTHYAALCLEADVIIFGPGKYGAWPDCELPMLANGWTRTKAGIVRRFAETINEGDLVVLRVGTQNVYGVGEVVGGYQWNDLFRDVQGWDLQHVRRVRWLWHQDGKEKRFPVYSMKFGTSVQYLISPEVRHWLESLTVPEEAYSRELKPLN
jgi:hypothetical protein